MSGIIETVKKMAHKQRETLNKLIAMSLQDIADHCEEIDMILSLDFDSMKDPYEKLLAEYLAQDALREAKEAVASAESLIKAQKILDRIG